MKNQTNVSREADKKSNNPQEKRDDIPSTKREPEKESEKKVAQ